MLPKVLSNDLDNLGKSTHRWALEPVMAGAHKTVVAHDQWRAAVAAYLACVSFVDARYEHVKLLLKGRLPTSAAAPLGR